jgi:inner membrane protein
LSENRGSASPVTAATGRGFPRDRSWLERIADTEDDVRSNLLVKILILFALIVASAVALVIIRETISARARYRASATEEVARSVGRSQTVMGPLIVAPYRERIEADATAPLRVAMGDVVLLPESLDVRSTVQVEGRSRGIYRVQVYHARQRLTGVFKLPARLGIAEDRAIVGSEAAILALSVSDSRGLRRPPRVTLNGVAADVRPGTGQTWLEQGFSVDLGPLFSPQPRQIAFDIELDLVGTERLGFMPVGASTHAVIESEWPHPSFTGGFLPDERTVNDRGFRASWQLSRYATGVDDMIQLRRQPSREKPVESDLAVRFIQPVDVYQQSERAVKYGILFVVLTFVAFFLYEVMRRLAVHPIQYALVAAALALFFLLLLSLAEHIPFAIAYVTASAGCIGLLMFYVGHVLRGFMRGLGFGALLAALYGVLYLLLQSEDYALLLGSLLLFGVLATIMFMTRRVDWYRIGGSPPGEGASITGNDSERK